MYRFVVLSNQGLVGGFIETLIILIGNSILPTHTPSCDLNITPSTMETATGATFRGQSHIMRISTLSQYYQLGPKLMIPAYAHSTYFTAYRYLEFHQAVFVQVS